MITSRGLTTTEIMAAATESFSVGGYRRIDSASEEWKIANSRLFEDEFGLVALVVFETWDALVSEWVDAQGALVELISRHLSRADPKAWEGYLVLLTPGVRGTAGKEEWMTIRYNTKRIRKLVTSGENLKSIGDVKAAVAPLLPLDMQQLEAEAEASVLDLVPELLEDERGIPQPVVQRVIAAFRGQSNMMRALHEARERDT